MNQRERVLAVLSGDTPDRIPWVPRLDLWYQARLAEKNMPARYENFSMRDLQRALGAADPARDGIISTTRYEGVQVSQKAKGDELLTEYVTPAGTIRQVEIQTEFLEHYASSGLLKEPPIKGPADYPVMEYIYEHTFFDPAYDEYLAYEAQIGDEGYPMVFLGDVPLHHFLLRLAGYNRAYFELADHLPLVEHLLQVMEQVEMERLWPVALASPARWFLHGLHFDSQITPPPLFERYITPYYRQVTPALHARGKWLAYHADNDARKLLRHILAAGFDSTDCFTTAPLVTVTLEEARRAWGSQVAIVGGIPSILLEPSVMPEEEFHAYVRQVLESVAPGERFMLAVADNVMPTSSIERVEWISRVVAGARPPQPRPV